MYDYIMKTLEEESYELFNLMATAQTTIEDHRAQFRQHWVLAGVLMHGLDSTLLDKIAVECAAKN